MDSGGVVALRSSGGAVLTVAAEELLLFDRGNGGASSTVAVEELLLLNRALSNDP